MTRVGAPSLPGQGLHDHRLARGAATRLHAEKKTWRARAASPEARAAFRKKPVPLPVKRLGCRDEVGRHLARSRAYARAPRGERAAGVDPCATDSNIAVLRALTWQGRRAPMMIDGAIDGAVRELEGKPLLVPELRPGELVLWDNVPTHKNKRAIALIEATGARVEPVPAYSPDLEPIEECISTVKTDVRRVKTHTARKLRYALKRAFAKVTQRDIRGWFQHCGYAVT